MPQNPTELRSRLKLALAATALGVAGLACSRSQAAAPATAADNGPPPDPTAADTTLLVDGAFQIPMPNWSQLETNDETTLRVVQSPQGWAMSVARQPLTPRLIARHLASVLPDHGDYSSLTVDDSRIDSPSIEGLSAGDPPLAIHYDFRYCDGATYQISASGPADSFAEFRRLYDGLIGQIQCAAIPPENPNQAGLVGLIINPARNDFTFDNFRASVVAARDGGVRASHSYFTWGDIETAPGEYDWTVPDILVDMMALEGIRMSVVIDFIHTSVPGKVPADLEGLAFDDPNYIDRASAFAVAVAEHYRDDLDYLMLGNEINIYLAQHPDQVEPFLTAYQAMRQAVHQARPELPVGTVLAFHELINAGDFGLLQQFKAGDFLAYTYYPHASGFRYDVPTDGFGAVLDQMIEQSGEMPFIVVENGWATSEALGGSEASQAEYIRNSFQAMEQRPGSFERLLFYGFHDGERSICEEGGMSFFPEGTDPSSLGESWNAFVEYLCTLGLRNYDGSPKLGWQAFQEQIAGYRPGG